MKKIKETKYTCIACGHVWYYGKSDDMENLENKAYNINKRLMCCLGCFPALLIPDKKIVSVDRCPKCNSKATKKEVIIHEVQ